MSKNMNNKKFHRNYKKIPFSISQFVMSICFVLLFSCLTGCSISHRDADEPAHVTTQTTSEQTTKDTPKKEATTEKKPMLPQNPEGEITDITYDIIANDSDLSSMEITDIKVEKDSENENCCKVTLALQWNIDFEPAVAKSLSKQRSDLISAKYIAQLPYVSELQLEYTIPSLNDAKATILYIENNHTLALKSTTYEEGFDK